ncbi:protein kinase FMP48 SCDLUD_000827 [Saccharomycodes ludwigii]|uniref:protein kinase FMP48 n=1 Tax=Saccharomycodes ludwigii TaxID=36035 RepID=UPI001E890DF0|nr:hypothetical protein SCDLUD_000827 [Saccharomycodes ludwigii]KAH3903208.1 hypothetical protein SCDLUD_000827 [Saccharomycodes ludwigii]
MKQYYRRISKIQSGSFSLVYKALNDLTKDVVALKCIPKPLGDNENNKLKKIIRVVSNEYKILNKLGRSNPFICTMVDFFETVDCFVFVLEYCEHGDLYDYIKFVRNNPSTATKIDFVKLVSQLVNALEYSHNLGITHRDIKPENILLDSNLNIKLTDWGLSLIGVKSTAACIGTEKYLAPETFAPNLILEEVENSSLAGEDNVPNYVSHKITNHGHTLNNGNTNHPGIGTSFKFDSSGYDCIKADYWSLGITLLYTLFASCPFKYASLTNPQNPSKNSNNRNFQRFISNPMSFIDEYYFQSILRQESMNNVYSRRTIHASMNIKEQNTPAFWLSFFQNHDHTEMEKSYRIHILHGISERVVKYLLPLDFTKRSLTKFDMHFQSFILGQQPQVLMRKNPKNTIDGTTNNHITKNPLFNGHFHNPYALRMTLQQQQQEQQQLQFQQQNQLPLRHQHVQEIHRSTQQQEAQHKHTFYNRIPNNITSSTPVMSYSGYDLNYDDGGTTTLINNNTDNTNSNSSAHNDNNASTNSPLENFHGDGIRAGIITSNASSNRAASVATSPLSHIGSNQVAHLPTPGSTSTTIIPNHNLATNATTINNNSANTINKNNSNTIIYDASVKTNTADNNNNNNNNNSVLQSFATNNNSNSNNMFNVSNYIDNSNTNMTIPKINTPPETCNDNVHSTLMMGTTTTTTSNNNTNTNDVNINIDNDSDLAFYCNGMALDPTFYANYANTLAQEPTGVANDVIIPNANNTNNHYNLLQQQPITDTHTNVNSSNMNIYALENNNNNVDIADSNMNSVSTGNNFDPFMHTNC